MFTRRTDLPLDKDDHGRFLPWLIAFMVFLACVALAGILAMQAVAARWDTGVGGTLTVQVPPAKQAAEREGRIRDVLKILATTKGIARYEVLSDAKVQSLLDPWLGSAVAVSELPLPQLIDVELEPDAKLEGPALAERLRESVKDVAVDDHRVWLRRLVRLISTVEMVAMAILGFVTLATVGTVVFTTRTGLAIHRDAIEVLHLIGAQDSYVARQFAARALRLGLAGGLLGLCLGVPTILGIGWTAQRLEGNLLPHLDLTFAEWMAVAAMPALVAALAMLTARITVLRTLRRML